MSETVVRKRGRPPKNIQPDAVDENPNGSEPKGIHQMVRGISKNGQLLTVGGGNFFPVDIVDEHVKSWLDQDYDLFDTHYLGETPEGYMVMYILVKQ